jgi:Flp pilus assembly protein TadD
VARADDRVGSEGGVGAPSAWVVALGLAALVFAVYAQTARFGFVNLDDPQYVTENPWVLRGLTADGVAWALGAFHAGNWHPLTWLSHMADVQLFGPDPGWHHLVNAILHIANTLLLFAWLRQMSGATWRSAIVAALFAVHPLHVESVAWVSERKDVLSTLFWLLASMAWVRYARRPRAGAYLASLGLFALGLAAKPMLVTLPFTLLLVDVWPLGRLGGPWAGSGLEGRRIGRLLLEKVPFLALAAASAAVTFLAQRETAVAALEGIPPGERIANALVSFSAYLVDALWPAGLAPFYPHPALAGAGTPAWLAGASAALLCAITVAALRAWPRRPYLAWGWLWYLGTLVPVIGIVQVGVQSRADRYTYVPLIGILVAAVWGVSELLGPGARAGEGEAEAAPGEGAPARRAAAVLLAAAAVLGLSVAAFVQAGHWRDGVALWTHALRVTERNWQAWTGLGDALASEGRLPEAVAALEEGIRIFPRQAMAWDALATANGRLGRLDLALRQSLEAVRLGPRQAAYWYNLGTTHGQLGQHDRARAAFREAVRLRPEMAKAWANLAVASRLLGDGPGTMEALRRLEGLDPAAGASLRQRLGAGP